MGGGQTYGQIDNVSDHLAVHVTDNVSEHVSDHTSGPYLGTRLCPSPSAHSELNWGQKGLNACNSPMCTLSQNGYGDQIARSIALCNLEAHIARTLVDKLSLPAHPPYSLPLTLLNHQYE